eukprot:GHRR01018432.1.p1 GENE.GHRR01018432.1~~GHRR01018432.1.p1  ORF type:complete len:281 (+),score=109.49 GHRR01018432.1:58-900(+)
MKFGPPKSGSSPSKHKWTIGTDETDKKTSLAKVIGTLKSAVEKLQLAQGLEAEKERRTTLENYISQVELLQTAFTSLADAVLEELDDLAFERLKLQKEQAAWASTIRDLEDKVETKLSGLRRLEDRLDVKLSVAAELPGQLEGLARQQRAGDAGLEGLRGEIKLLQAQLNKLERNHTLTASEAAVAPLNPTQRSQVKEAAHDALREHVPGLVAASINSHVPAMVSESRYSKSVEGVVAALVDDTVALSRNTRQLECMVNHQQGQLQDTKEALLRSVTKRA